MLLQGSGQQVQVHGAEESATSFRIAMNGKAFKVLSSTLYQDKIGSIVREISTNALDAHTMAGNTDEPFEIHLPDEFEPWFSVKDFGVGLSDDMVKNIYTVLFESTKDQSNDTVGAFGLGSKTPFSYTDQFTVTSIFDGKKTVYSAFLTPSGVPDLQPMHSEPCTERNGVEVSISVKRDDYRTFASKVREQLRFFKVKPVVVNAPYGFQFDDLGGLKLVASGKGFNIFAGSGTSWIIQGQVGYPLDFNQYLNISKNEDAKKFAHRIRYMSNHIEFPIGSIGVTASREAMEYTDFTVESIDKRFLEMKEELADSFKQISQNCKNNWEIAQLANETDLFGDKTKYQNLFMQKFAVPNLHRNAYSFPIDSMKFTVLQYRKHNSKPYSLEYVPISGNVKIFIAGGKYQRNKINILRDKMTDVFVVTLHNGFTKADLSLALGGYSDFESIEDIPFTPVKRASVSRPKVACWRYNDFTNTKMWDREEDMPEDEEIAYVVLERGTPVWEDQYWNFIHKFITIANFETLPELYGIREKDLDKFLKANPKAVRMKNWVDNKVKELRPTLVRYQKIKNIADALKFQFGDVEYNEKLLKANYKFMKLQDLFKKVCEKGVDMNKAEISENIIGKVSTRLADLIEGYKKKAIESHPILSFPFYQIREKLTPEQFEKYLEVQF